MSRRKNLLLGALLAAAWILPQNALASGGRLPSVARAALMGTIRANVTMPRCPGAKIRPVRNGYQSKGLQSGDYLRVNGRTQAGRAYVYDAKIEMPGAKSKDAGSYVIAERQDRSNGQAYWEVRPLATPLRADGKVSKQSTKRVTRPKSGQGEIKVAFINKGLGVTQKNAAGITARDATVARAAYRDGSFRAEVLAKRINFDAKTITYYALGGIARDANGNRIEGKAVVETTIQGEPAPMFTRQRMIAPPGTGPQRPTWRPEWNSIPVTATIEKAAAPSVTPAPPASKK